MGMIFKSLELANFRSYEQAKFDLGEGITLVAGPNASGKTNLLESLFTLAVTKSFRANDQELIHHGQNHFRVVAETAGHTFAIGYSTEDGRRIKQITHDGVKKSLTSHIGNLQLVLFEPNDLGLISGPPEARRRYLDYILCQTDRNYLLALQRYRRILKQRNRLLDGFEIGVIQDQIFAWDLKLTQAAIEIFEGRQGLVGHINLLADDIYAQIAGSGVNFRVTYLPSVAGRDYGASFMESLATNLTRDLAAGFTTIGPHREDFRVNFGDNAVAAVASRGEVRTTVLALKLAELAYAEASTQAKPVLLLDDVFSELDHSRRRYLMKKLKDHQAIITTTDADVLADFKGDFKLIRTARPKPAPSHV